MGKFAVVAETLFISLLCLALGWLGVALPAQNPRITCALPIDIYLYVVGTKDSYL